MECVFGGKVQLGQRHRCAIQCGFLPTLLTSSSIGRNRMNIFLTLDNLYIYSRCHLVLHWYICMVGYVTLILLF